MGRITFEGYRCERCGHTWAPRQALDSKEKPPLPKVCPECKSAWWDVPKRVPSAKSKGSTKRRKTASTGVAKVS